MEREGIEGDVTVSRLLASQPAAAAVFVRHGMACVGCAMAPFDTLADAAAAYGLALQAFLADLAHAAPGTLLHVAASCRDTTRSGSARPPRRDTR
jgi:hybrid cluster-associated redox disulfide protein